MKKRSRYSLSKFDSARKYAKKSFKKTSFIKRGIACSKIKHKKYHCKVGARRVSRPVGIARSIRRLSSNPRPKTRWKSKS